MGTAAVAPAPLPHANRNAGWQLPPPSGPPSGSAPTGPGNGAEVIDLTDGNGQQQYVMPAFLHDLRAHHQPYQQQLGLTPGHQTLPQSLPNQQQAMAEGFSQPRVFPGSYANLINPLPGSAAAPVLQPTAFIPQRDISSHVLDWRHIQQQQQSQQQQQQQQPLQQQHTGIGHVVSGQTSSLQAWLAQGLAQQAAHMQARSLAPTHTSAPIEAHPSLGAQIQAVAQRMLEAVQATGTSPDVQSIFEHARSWVLNRQQAAADALLQQLAGQARVQYPSGYPYQNRGVVSGQPYAPPARYTENGAGLGGVYGGTGGKVPLQFAAPPPGKAPAVSYAAASPSTNAAAALRAIIEGMEAVGPLGEGEMQPPEVSRMVLGKRNLKLLSCPQHPNSLIPVH